MISVFGSDVGPEEIKAVTEVMESQWLGCGKKVAEFEQAYMDKFGIKNFLMVDSGSNALYMAVKLLDLPPNSKIILPSFTWVACVQAILLAGHKPIFCDVDVGSMNVTPIKINDMLEIHSDAKAIMVVHFAGLPCAMDSIMGFGLPVVEDCAHTVGHRSEADIAIYSFDPVKNMTTGEGGAIACHDDAMYERAKTLRYCGIGKSGFQASQNNASGRWWEYNIVEPFIKMMPTDIAGAIGVEQLKRIDLLQQKRKMIWSMYDDELDYHDHIRLPWYGLSHSRFTFVITVDEGRDELAKHLYANGIYTTLRYHPLHMNAIYGQTDTSLPSCEYLNNHALSLPLHPRMTTADVNKVIGKVKDFFK